MSNVADFQEEVAVNKKTLLHVGGLDDRVTEEVLQNAFIPFGELISVTLPRQQQNTGASTGHATAQHRGFALIEFTEAEDAAAAIDNMHNAELYGRVLTVKLSAGRGAGKRSVWADADAWMQTTLAAKAD